MFSILQRSFFRFRPKTGHPALGTARRREQARIRPGDSPTPRPGTTQRQPDRRPPRETPPPAESPQHFHSAATLLPQDHCSTPAVSLQSSSPQWPEAESPPLPELRRRRFHTQHPDSTRLKNSAPAAFLKTDPQDAMPFSDTKRRSRKNGRKPQRNLPTTGNNSRHQKIGPKKNDSQLQRSLPTGDNSDTQRPLLKNSSRPQPKRPRNRQQSRYPKTAPAKTDSRTPSESIRQ